MAKSIPISPKHGLNPSMGVCFYCGKADGTIIIPGRLPGDVEAPREAVWSLEPCPECKKLTEQGIMFIEVRDGEKGSNNPLRTGRLWVIKEEAAKQIFREIPPLRIMFIERADAIKIGFPEVS